MELCPDRVRAVKRLRVSQLHFSVHSANVTISVLIDRNPHVWMLAHTSLITNVCRAAVVNAMGNGCVMNEGDTVVVQCIPACTEMYTSRLM